jgi:hypothetical protein
MSPFYCDRTQEATLGLERLPNNHLSEPLLNLARDRFAEDLAGITEIDHFDLANQKGVRVTPIVMSSSIGFRFDFVK